MSGWINVRMGGWMDEWIGGCKDEWMDVLGGCIDNCKSE